MIVLSHLELISNNTLTIQNYFKSVVRAIISLHHYFEKNYGSNPTRFTREITRIMITKMKLAVVVALFP